jgi:hypothetical protein
MYYNSDTVNIQSWKSNGTEAKLQLVARMLPPFHGSDKSFQTQFTRTKVHASFSEVSNNCAGIGLCPEKSAQR